MDIRGEKQSRFRAKLEVGQGAVSRTPVALSLVENLSLYPDCVALDLTDDDGDECVYTIAFDVLVADFVALYLGEHNHPEDIAESKAQMLATLNAAIARVTNA